jgi:hypothetical protein
MLPFLKEEKIDLRTQITFKGSKMEIYIPSYFFDSSSELFSMASIIGRRIETIGLFWFFVDGKFYELQIPIKVSFEFSETEKVKKKLKPGMPEIDYEVFTLKNGDAFIHDIMYKQSIDDVINFIQKLVEGAKLPQTLSYEEVLGVYLKILEVSKIGKGLGVNSVTLEFILSELYRDKRNTTLPFRKTFNGKSIGPYDFKMLRIVKVPEMNSTFTGLTGEDINQQFISAILKNREGNDERISPIEKIIKY